MDKMYRLCEVEELIADMDFSDVDDDIAETDEEYQLIISGWWVHVPELNLNLYEGVVCNWEEESQMFMPDFAVTVVYEADAEHQDYIYYEQDGMVITLANWLNGRVPLENIEQMRCYIRKE